MTEETLTDAGVPEDGPRPATEDEARPDGNPAAPGREAEEAAGDVIRRERDEYLELAQRARADFDNFRKRSARDVSEAERRGKMSVVRDLVPVVDNLERALRSAGVNPDGPDTEEVEASTQEVSAEQALTQGVALVYRELKVALQRAGVEAYDPAGERFDPAWHEALSTLPAEGTESGTIVETLEKGYRVDGQVLRAARVVVAG